MCENHIACAWGECVLLFFFCIFVQPSHWDAEDGRPSNRGSTGLVQCDPWSSPTVGSLAERPTGPPVRPQPTSVQGNSVCVDHSASGACERSPTSDEGQPHCHQKNSEVPCWEQLDQVNLAEWFLKRIPMLKTCPHFLRGRLRQCFAVALRERYRARQSGDIQAEERAWKVFGLIPMMLMHRPQELGGSGRVGEEGR